MPKVRIQAGAELDVLNRGELNDGLQRQTDAWFREMAHGLKYMRMAPLAGNVSAGAALLGAGANLGPAQGFAWAIQRLTVAGLAAADVLTVFRNTTDPQNMIGNVSGTSPVFHVGSHGFILLPGDALVLSGSGLTTTSTIVVNGELVEAPATQIWKLL